MLACTMCSKCDVCSLQCCQAVLPEGSSLCACLLDEHLAWVKTPMQACVTFVFADGALSALPSNSCLIGQSRESLLPNNLHQAGPYSSSGHLLIISAGWLVQ